MKTIKELTLLLGAIALSIAGCEKNNQDEQSVAPFNNGSAVRNEIVVISDLHMGANLDYSEINHNLKPLEDFLASLKSSPNVKELVIAGDLVDEWFVPADVNTYDGKDQADFVKRVASTNQGVVDAFNNIIKEGKIKVTYVPGNHDLTITPENINLILPGINQARDQQLGLGTYTPSDFPALAIEHSHRYNYFCAPDMLSNQTEAPGTILPAGYFFTRIGALHVKQKCTQNLDVLPAVTPNLQGDASQKLMYAYWQIWKWAMGYLPINNHFSENIIITGVNGFNGVYSVNDLIPYQSTTDGPISVKLFNGAQDNWEARQTKNNVAVHIPVDHAIANSSNADETDNLAIKEYFQNPNSDKRIVVFGHNHRATIIPSYNFKGQKSIYANSGTWIDSNPGGATPTFVIITPQNDDSGSETKVEVYNFEKEVYTQMAMNTVRL